MGSPGLPSPGVLAYFLLAIAPRAQCKAHPQYNADSRNGVHCLTSQPASSGS